MNEIKEAIKEVVINQPQEWAKAVYNRIATNDPKVVKPIKFAGIAFWVLFWFFVSLINTWSFFSFILVSTLFTVGWIVVIKVIQELYKKANPQDWDEKQKKYNRGW